MLDQTDREILKWLQRDSRMQWKEIGEKVHLTGQAVAARVRKFEDLGLIEAFTVKVNPEKLGRSITALITVFMKNTDQPEFRGFLEQKEMVIEAHRVSGEGCYWIKANVASEAELNSLLDEILKYGNYRVNLSIGKVK